MDRTLAVHPLGTKIINMGIMKMTEKWLMLHELILLLTAVELSLPTPTAQFIPIVLPKPSQCTKIFLEPSISSSLSTFVSVFHPINLYLCT